MDSRRSLRSILTAIKAKLHTRGIVMYSMIPLLTMFPQYRNSILLLKCDVLERDFGGGPGGKPSPDAICDGGFVAVGFHVQTGRYFNQAWLDCAPMRSDGSLGEERRMTRRTGSPGGQEIHDAMCRPGRALMGLTGHTGSSIDEAVGMCHPLRDGDDRNDRDRDRDRGYDRRGDDRRDDDRSRGEYTEPVTIPRPGGRPAEARCPDGSVMVGFRSRSGEWMDHLYVLCSEIQRTY